MKYTLFAMILVLLAVFFAGCKKADTDSGSVFSKQPVKEAQRTPNPKSTNPISGPVQKANYQSAASDASQAVMVFLAEAGDDGASLAGEGLIFEITKDDGVYYFSYSNGKTEYIEEEVRLGEELTPQSDSWLKNVRVFKR